ncbi:MAG: YeeE/YedE family protein, partial [Candidatus Marinimicrobia bacterium]|nr:YeeE/YedE family protein [Candidatus Neomarinimicrobiota bacterium]
MGPLVPNEVIAGNWNFLIAFVIGIGFGFILEQAGFSSSRKLAGMFYGYDTVVLKVFFTGAITAMLGLLFFSLFGWVDLNLVYVNPTYLWSAIIGGVIMGLGFIAGGFCPGTSICAAAIGKIDAMIFIAGIFLGVFIFGE